MNPVKCEADECETRNVGEGRRVFEDGIRVEIDTGGRGWWFCTVSSDGTQQLLQMVDHGTLYDEAVKRRKQEQ